VQELTQAAKEKLLHLEERLHERVIGQEEAIVAVSDAIRRSRAGLATQKGQLPLCYFWDQQALAKRNWQKH